MWRRINAKLPRVRGIGTHINAKGVPSMISVSDKPLTKRTASARSVLHLPPPVAAAIKDHMRGEGGAIDRFATKKGPLVSTVIVGATFAVKNTAATIPFCHPLPIEHCSVDYRILNEETCASIEFIVSVATTWKTGVEMEALVGASTAALVAYDMLKGIPGAQPLMRVGEVSLLEKRGGKSDVAGSTGDHTVS